jgi:hypothetical protein
MMLPTVFAVGIDERFLEVRQRDGDKVAHEAHAVVDQGAAALVEIELCKWQPPHLLVPVRHHISIRIGISKT